MHQEQELKDKMNRIAIIGSGITGISVGFQQGAKAEVTMFDKSRKPGGRVSTRTSRQHTGYSFDHGVPFVTVSGQFLDYLKKIEAVREDRLQVGQFNKGNIEKTSERFLWSGNPGIETIPIKLIEQLSKRTNLKLQFDTKITQIQQRGEYFLQSEQNREFGPFDQIYVCLPYPQCRALKQNLVKFPEEASDKREYNCKWVIMVAFDKGSQISKKFAGYDICENIGEGIASMISQKTKGNTSEDDLWVFTMEEKWCQQNINLKPEAVENQFRQKMSIIFGKDIIYKFIKAHRWLYSQPQDTPSQPVVGQNIVFGADWLNKRSNVQQCWQLGPILHRIMNEKASHL